MQEHGLTKKPNEVCSVSKNKLFYILFQIYIFPPMVLEHLLTVEEKTSIPLAKITEDSQHALS